MTPPVSVLIVDDHAMVRAGLEQLLGAEDDIQVLGTAEDGADALVHVEHHHPDVVLMDLHMPELDGVAATASLAASHPEVRVVILTSYSDRDRIVAAIDAGAVGYLLKDAKPEDIVAGVRAAARGESPLHPKAARELLTDRAGKAGASRPELTPREVEVLTLVRSGLSNKQIARRLGIAERTVKAHLTSCFQRIGVADRTQAALWAERNGIGAD
jgi:DNA-binding NarL/FixJ family response regulator